MSMLEALNDAIVNKYKTPIRRSRRLFAGVEFEFPIVNLEKKPVDFAVVGQLTDAFIAKFGFSRVTRDNDGRIYLAIHPDSGDGLSYDCSFNTLEFSFGVEENLNVLHKRFSEYYDFIEKFFASYHYTLTGMGINPYHHINRNIPIANERYRMLFHHLQSYTKYDPAFGFHDIPNFGLICAASQVQLDTEYDSVVDTINAFEAIEPLKALLFANSPYGDYLCARDWFWKKSLHGWNPANVDFYGKRFESVDDILAYIRTMSLYCVERDGKYINFVPTPLETYFSSETITGEFYNGTGYESVTFAPRIEDLSFLRSYKFEDLTFRGTIEFRSVCEQPVSEILASAALHAGLMEMVPELKALVSSDRTLYNKGMDYAQLREAFNRRELPSWLDRKSVSALILKVIDLASQGLSKRGFSEGWLLEPLVRRAELLMSPAREVMEGMARGESLESYIEKFAQSN